MCPWNNLSGVDFATSRAEVGIRNVSQATHVGEWQTAVFISWTKLIGDDLSSDG
jgi:hypothetical protein